MRARILSGVIALLAVAALVIHLTVPFASYEIADQMGVEPGSGTYTVGELKDARAQQDETNRPYVIVPGSSLTYLLTGAIVLTLGALVFFGSQFMRGTAGSYTRVGGGILTALGAGFSIHGNGLWSGRGISSLIHMLGWDAPPGAYKDTYLANFSPMDIVSSWMPISPFILTFIGLAIVILLAYAWVPAVRDERNMRHLAKRHGRLAIIGAVALVVALLMPWVVQVLEHGLTEGPNPADEDPFFWSAYDVMFYREVSFGPADEVGESGLLLWVGLSIALRALMIMGIAGMVVPFIALAGKQIESDGNPVLGRMLENIGLLAVLTHAYLILAAFMGAFVLLNASDQYASTITGLPLLLMIPAGIGVVWAGMVGRDVIADETDLVADDFPEPVVYD
jgi:hypothetical protein